MRFSTKIIALLFCMAGANSFAANLSVEKHFAMGSGAACKIDGQNVICNGSSSLFPGIRTFQNPKIVTAGGPHACVLDDKGVTCWGSNHSASVPISQVPQLKNPYLITSGDGHACVADDDGVKCWGDNFMGQLNAPALKKPTEISAGGAHSCAIDEGKVFCWGWGEGNPDLQPPAGLKNPRMLTTGRQHACVADDNDTSCVGDNWEYQARIPNTKTAYYMSGDWSRGLFARRERRLLLGSSLLFPTSES